MEGQLAFNALPRAPLFFGSIKTSWLVDHSFQNIGVPSSVSFAWTRRTIYRQSPEIHQKKRQTSPRARHRDLNLADASQTHSVVSRSASTRIDAVPLQSPLRHRLKHSTLQPRPQPIEQAHSGAKPHHHLTIQQAYSPPNPSLPSRNPHHPRTNPPSSPTPTTQPGPDPGTTPKCPGNPSSASSPPATPS